MSPYLKLVLCLALSSACLSCAKNHQTKTTVPGRMVLSADDLKDLPNETLAVKMGDDLPWTRYAAAQILAQRGGQSVTILENALASPDWRVVRAGQDGLRLVLKQANRDKNEGLRKAVVKALPKLRQTLKHKHYYVRMGGLECMKGMGPDAAVAIKEVCACIDDPDYQGVAPKAVQVIGSIGLENVDKELIIPVLGKAVRSTHLNIRRPAIDLVAKLDKAAHRKLVPDLLYTLNHQTRDGYTRFQAQGKAAKILTDLGVDEALPLMINILGEDGWGESHRMNVFLPLVVPYGTKAAAAIPHIEKTIALFEKRRTGADIIPGMKEAIRKLKGEGANNEKK